jgi:hypothetical protein
MAKSFQLPDVAVGSIVEYRYRRALQAGYVFDSRWLLSQELFTRPREILAVPVAGLRVALELALRPADGYRAAKKDRDKIRLETHRRAGVRGPRNSCRPKTR